MQTRNTLRYYASLLGWSALNVILLLIAGALPLPAWAQSAAGGATGGTVEHSTSTTTTTTTTPDVSVNGDSNTWLLIAIAVIAFLVLVIALARSASSRKEVRKTTVVR